MRQFSSLLVWDAQTQFSVGAHLDDLLPDDSFRAMISYLWTMQLNVVFFSKFGDILSQTCPLPHPLARSLEVLFYKPFKRSSCLGLSFLASLLSMFIHCKVYVEDSRAEWKSHWICNQKAEIVFLTFQRVGWRLLNILVNSFY